MSRQRPPSLKSFAEEANEPPVGFLREFLDFLMYNTKWWLTPIIIVLLLMSALAILSTTSAAPFIYALF